MNAAVYAPTVKLEGVPGPSDDKPVWVQIARAGRFEGYGGGAFEFTPLTFDTIIANFHRSPAYVRGANGFGTADVIAWDFHHASEMPAAQVGVSGSPAQGWILDLQSRRGADGVVQLWALTRWLEPARSYIRNSQYRFASVSVTLDAVDPVSGRTIGPVLTSVALTNQPFIEGMQPLAASNALARGNNKPITLKARIARSDARPVLNVSMQHGPTPFAKLLAHVRATNPTKSYDDCAELAMQLNRSNRVIA